MKILTVTLLALVIITGCGQTGPLRPAQESQQESEASE